MKRQSLGVWALRRRFGLVGSTAFFMAFCGVLMTSPASASSFQEGGMETSFNLYSLSDNRPIVGKRKVLIIPVAFADLGFEAGIEKKLEAKLFAPSGSSLSAYFKEVSYGKLQVEGVVAAPVTLEQSSISFDPASLDSEAVKLLVSLAILGCAEQMALENFDQVSADGSPFPDQVIDYIGIVYVGKRRIIHPHHWQGSELITIHGKEVSSYFIAGENDSLGVFVHEFSHQLGFPDLYDGDFADSMAGGFDAMAYGYAHNDGQLPAHFSAYLKIKAGWISEHQISASSEKIYLQPSTRAPSVVKVPLDELFDESYLLLEYRSAEGFDSGLQQNHLLVWQIDQQQGDNKDGSSPLRLVYDSINFRSLEETDAHGKRNIRIAYLVNGSQQKKYVNIRMDKSSNFGLDLTIDRPSVTMQKITFEKTLSLHATDRLFAQNYNRQREPMILVRRQENQLKIARFESYFYYKGVKKNNTEILFRVYQAVYFKNEARPAKLLWQSETLLPQFSGSNSMAKVVYSVKNPAGENSALIFTQDVFVAVYVPSSENLYLSILSKPGAGSFMQSIDGFQKVNGIRYLIGCDVILSQVKTEQYTSSEDMLQKHRQIASEMVRKNNQQDALLNYQKWAAQFDANEGYSSEDLALNFFGEIAFKLKNYSLAQRSFQLGIMFLESHPIYENVEMKIHFHRRLAQIYIKNGQMQQAAKTIQDIVAIKDRYRLQDRHFLHCYEVMLTVARFNGDPVKISHYNRLLQLAQQQNLMMGIQEQDLYKFAL